MELLLRMHELEPHFNWRGYYTAETDPQSPFFGRTYSEFEFSQAVYNYYLHPQWDSFGSPTLFTKILWADYEDGFAILEMIGEWNDAIHNDIMYLKRDVIELLIEEGINKFIVMGEHVFNFHASDDCYYEEWFDEVEDGWIAFINFREHVMREMSQAQIDHYLIQGGELEDIEWRTLTPMAFCQQIDALAQKRLN